MTNYDNDKVYSELAEKILEICSSKSKKNHKDILDNIENNKENFLSNLQQIIKNPASLYNEKVSLLGLIIYKKLLEKNIEKLEINISSLEINNRELKKSKSDLERDYAVAENLAGLKEESKSHVKLYGIFLFCAIIALGVIMYCSYTYGIGILSDLKELSKPPSTRASSDYFGLFLLKLPFALLMGLGISGIVIFLNKILMLIERINNQQRSISQIIVIAKQIDETTINLIKNENSEEYQNAKKEKDEKNLFYKLITNHLVSISKNEMELQNKNNDTMKTLKEFSNIIKGVTPIGEKK